MRPILWFVLALSLLVACKSAPPEVDCSTVSRGIETYWARRAAAAETEAERTEIVEATAVAAARLERHCKADGWSPEIIICVRAVFRLEDSGCMKKFTPEQAGALLMDDSMPRPAGGGTGLGG
jgi:hypothetical protein